MAAITMGPIASGLPKDIVERLMEAERRPLVALERRKQNEQNRLKLVEDLNSRLSQINAEFAKLAKFKSFRELGVKVGRPELMDVSVNKEEAEEGEYALEVIQLAGRSSMLSNGFADPDETQIGVGYFSYELPNGEVRETFIGQEENTLQEIANKINRDRSLNLQALVVNDGTGSEKPWRLIISHNKSGEESDAEFPTFYFVDGDEDFYLEKERPAQNSVLKVNGFEVEFEGTHIETLLPGVSIDLKDIAPGKEFTLKIFEDNAKIEAKIKSLVEKINEVLSFIQKQNTLDEKSDTSNTLGGDVTLQNIESLVRKIVLTPLETSDGPVSMQSMGVTFQRNGLLEANDAKLKKSLQTNFNAIGEFFTGVNDSGKGFISKLTDAIKSYTQQGGIVHSRSEGIKRRIKDIDKQIENTERQLEETRRNLQEKFANLESSLAKMRGQQQQVQGALGGGNFMDSVKLG